MCLFVSFELIWNVLRRIEFDAPKPGKQLATGAESANGLRTIHSGTRAHPPPKRGGSSGFPDNLSNTCLVTQCNNAQTLLIATDDVFNFGVKQLS